jgi:hypothetical protein
LAGSKALLQPRQIGATLAGTLGKFSPLFRFRFDNISSASTRVIDIQAGIAAC